MNDIGSMTWQLIGCTIMIVGGLIESFASKPSNKQWAYALMLSGLLGGC